MKNILKKLMIVLNALAPTLLLLLIMFSGVSAYNSFWPAKIFLTSGNEAHTLDSLSAEDLENDLWIKAELDIVINRYLQVEKIYKNNEDLSNLNKRYNYFIPMTGNDGSEYYLTIYVPEERNREFMKLYRAFKRLKPITDKRELVSYEARVKALPDDEKALFKETLISEYNMTAAEAEQVILPYALTEIKVEGGMQKFILSIVVFIASLVLLLSYFIRYEKDARKRAKEEKAAEKAEQDRKNQMIHYINDYRE